MWISTSSPGRSVKSDSGTSAVPADGHRHLQAVGVLDGLGRGDAGAERTAAFVDLRLREIEGILFLDGATADVVADGIAVDLALMDDDGEFRFGVAFTNTSGHSLR